MNDALETSFLRWCQSFVDYGPDDATTRECLDRYHAELRRLDEPKRLKTMKEHLHRPEYRKTIRAAAKLTGKKYSTLSTIARHYLGTETSDDKSGS
jgi:hypothetical protein